MMFKIGDEVLVVSPPDRCKELVGEIGVIIESQEDEDLLPFCVKFAEKAYVKYWWCEEESLQLFQPVLENI